MTKKLSKFPYDHVVKVLEKEVWITCDSSFTALSLPKLVEKYYPGYTGKIATQEYFEKMRNQLAN